ncbi:hypothetical protein BCR32DRAFT_293122 [Anaeromyces robustus]|uniref:HIT-type domain-containing protein n=1 Tax=Anaeromyces robustus TaxID=1754192 RepID=A0A1Y1X7K2_9FUNG|nr:hypothetical protein BCR32DRAFT_293122 [Anaeromyces robustus]|eukprot:ORX81749.1 hypothetical protein BCR32DRAFT_293122 [Anaeromyces robustus]
MSNPIINNNETQICQICFKQYKKYLCPRCNLQYCSKTCYQSKKHKCAEVFFKENFMNLLKGEKVTDTSKNKVLKILKRLEETSYDLEYTQESDSEDELSNRFSELNLDKLSFNVIWNKLNEKEREQFNNLLKNQKELNSKLDEIIIPWKPWWEYMQKENEKNKIEKSILIKDIEKINQNSKINSSENNIMNNNINYPILNGEIQKLNKSTIFLGYNLIDIIMSYVYVTRYFNGEMHNYINEACEIIWNLTTILEDELQYNFNNIEEILEAKTINCQKNQVINSIEQNIMIIKDTINIMNYRKSILLVLSDMVELFKNYQTMMKEEKKKKKLKKDNNDYINITIKKSFKTEKKLYYYLCYVNSEEILTNDLLSILTQNLELKNNELNVIKKDISKNKEKYDKIKEKNIINKNNKRVLIEEL